MPTKYKKNLNIQINEDIHYKIKMQALKEKLSIKDFILNVLISHINENSDDTVILEPLDEEDIKDLEECKDEEYEDAEEFFKELESES